MFPSTGAGSQNNGVAVIGSSKTSTPYACTSTGINQAVSDAVNRANNITQSVVDASNCTSMDSTAFTSEIDVGLTTPPYATKYRIKLIVPANGTWTTTIADGSSYALKWGNGAMIYGGTGSGEGQPFTIVAGANSNLRAVCGNDPSIDPTQHTANAPYFHAEGFSCLAGTGSKIQDAVIEIANSADESYVGHVDALAAGGANAAQVSKGLWVHNSCCSSTFEDINADMGGSVQGMSPSAVPCYFGNGSNDKNQGIHVSKLSCVHPGYGQNAMLIQQTGGTSSFGFGNSFRDIFMEEGGGQDNATPWVAISLVGNAADPAADLLDGIRASGDVSTARYVVDIGSGISVNISNLELSFTSQYAINDHANGVSVTAPLNSVIASYDTSPRYRLSLGAMTVNSLPPAASNVRTMFGVSDSTAITTEGQTCAGGGTNSALAFSNGSVWKCF
jgi:hypothetical protein